MTAIVFNEKVTAEHTRYEFRLHGNLFTPDIEELGNKLGEAVDDLKTRSAEFVLDLTQADPALFKPTRLYGVCAHLGDEILRRGLDAKLALRLIEEHQRLLPDLGALRNVEVTVVTNPIADLERPISERQASKEKVRPSEFRLSIHMVQAIINAQRPWDLYDYLQNSRPPQPTTLRDDAITRVSHEVIATLVDFSKRIQRLATTQSLPDVHIVSERFMYADLTFADPLAALLHDNLMLSTNRARDVVRDLHEELATFLGIRTIAASWGEFNVSSDGLIHLRVNRLEARQRFAGKVRVTRLH